jgi:hypothetical protein
MNKEKLIIFTLVAFVAYHMFLKERFEVQKTDCSLYPIALLCEAYETKGCSINPNKVMGDDQDFCICSDPSKGCNIDTQDKSKQAYDNLLKAYDEWTKNKTQSNKDKWSEAWKKFQDLQPM